MDSFIFAKCGGCWRPTPNTYINNNVKLNGIILLLISILDITLQMIFPLMRISIDNVEHCVQGNILCSLDVKPTPFRTYCSPMYKA